MTEIPPSLQRLMWRFVAALVRLLPRDVAGALALSVLTGLTEGLGTLLLVPLLAAVGLDVSAGGVGGIDASVRAFFGYLGVPVTLGPALLLYAAVVSAQALFSRWQTVAALALEYHYIAALRADLYGAYARARWAFQRTMPAADVLHVLVQEVDRVGMATYQALSAASLLIVSLAYLAIAARVSPAMTLLVACAGGVVLLALRGRVAKSGHGGRMVSEQGRRLHLLLSEQLAATRLVKALGREEQQIATVARAAATLEEAHADAVHLHAGSRTTSEIGGAVALSVLLYVGLVWLRLDAGGVVLLLYVFARLMPRLSALQQSAEQIAHLLPAFGVVDTFRARAVAARELTTVPDASNVFKGDLRFDRVTFTHPGRTDPVLQDVSFVVPACGVTAIVGPSGSGKSTIADLACGLLRPDSGTLAVGDVALDDHGLLAWRRCVGYVEQDPFLLNDTIRTNLTLAQPGASDARMNDALAAAAADFVFERPAGLDTIVGERGAQLSGGERQRLAIARALLSNPRLLVLDEATRGLDAVSEARVLDAIERLSTSVPIVLITHRLLGLRRARNILVLENGRLVEHGDWGTLMARSAGRFRAMHDAQGMRLGNPHEIPSA